MNHPETLPTGPDTSRFPPGSLVSARGRDWIVLPETEPDVLRLRPLTGAGEAEAGVFMPLEGRDVRPAVFEWPDPEFCGDATGVMTLFDAARLSLRSGAAPFRSLGRISVTPRPYQFVPLVMALRQDPVRLLIADDVGVGKTIEAGMIVSELLARGLAKRFAVLAPAHLTGQWHQELGEKFGLSPTLVQSGTFLRLERDLPRQDVSVYGHYEHFVASIDFVKFDRHRAPFIANAPDLIVVDEAHMAARPRGQLTGNEQRRYSLLRELAEKDPNRHIILVTATPHSGVEESFRSLLGLLDPEFDSEEQDLDHRLLLPHLVQRRRADVAKWLGDETPFPERINEEAVYDLSKDYRALFDDVLEYCRQTVANGDAETPQQRVRHWAAIALLRCLLSSPLAAAAILENRSERFREKTEKSEETSPDGDGDARKADEALLGEGKDAGEAIRTVGEEIDETYSPQVMDALGDGEASDLAPTAPFEDETAEWDRSERARLLEFKRRAQALAGPEQDTKLAALAERLGAMLEDGCRPIVFCRFIQTARYLEKQLCALLKKGKKYKNLDIRAVTGELGDGERRERIDDLVKSDRRILIATDCLSEGINLQEGFDSVVHYDLPWNPNRLEQREGRVDRYGQPCAEVRATLVWGRNNPVDQVVLEVLIRKAREIRAALGIAVPVPVESDQVIRVVMDNVLLRTTKKSGAEQYDLGLMKVTGFHREWEADAAKAEKQRTRYAQEGIQPEEVQKEIEATDSVLGDAASLRRFVADAIQRFGGELKPRTKRGTGTAPATLFSLSPGDLRGRLPGLSSGDTPVDVTFSRQDDPKALCLGRTHDLVEGLCDTVLGKAFDVRPEGDEDASPLSFARAGAMVTDAVERRTVLLLLRFRYLFQERQRRFWEQEEPGTQEFAEEVVLAGFTRKRSGNADGGGDGGDNEIDWLDPLADAARELAERARPKRNIDRAERAAQVGWAQDLLAGIGEWYAPILDWRRQEIAGAHRRLRELSGRDDEPGLAVQPYPPPDILGCFVLVPSGSAG